MQFEIRSIQSILLRISFHISSQMSNVKLTVRSALWNHAGKILEYLLMYATSIIIARGLGVVENGRFVGLFSLSQLLLAAVSIGLETSLNKFIPQLEQKNNGAQVAFILRRSVLIRGLAFCCATIAFLTATVFITVPFFSQNEQILVWVFAFTAVRSFFPLFAMVLTAQLRTALTARINLTIRTIEIIGIIALWHYELTVLNVFVLFLVSSALHVSLYVFSSRLHFFAKPEPVEMKPIIAFGGIYWINTLVDFILGRQGDVFFLTNLLPDSAQGGLYDVAYSIAQFASMAMTVGLAGITFATFARLAVQDQGMMDRFYGFSIRIISLLTIPLYTFLIVHSRELLSILYSSNYLDATMLVQGILVFRIVSRLFGGPENAEYLLSKGKVHLIVGIGLVAAGLNILLNVIMIPTYGAMGSVIASGSGNLLVNAVAAIAVYRTSMNKLQLVFWFKLTVISVLAAFASGYVIPSSLPFSMFAAGLVFLVLIAGSLVLIKPFTEADEEWLAKADQRVKGIIHRFVRVEPKAS